MKRRIPALLASASLVLAIVGFHGTAQAQGDDPSQATAGEAVFEMSCAGCHASDGTGVAGLGRPLIGIASQGDRATHLASIADGKGSMPAFGDRLGSEEIEQVASYVRLTFVEVSASSDSGPTELAMTGISNGGLALTGVAMMAGGLQLTIWSRRRTANRG